MINALYEPFPEEIEVGGIAYPIVTDFREWFRFADMLADEELEKEEKLYLMTEWLLDVPEKITSELVKAVFNFYKVDDLKPDSPEADDEEETEQPKRPPVFDWKYDAAFILGDFRRYYGIDLLSVEYMHWWKFRCLFNALPDDSQCQKRIAYRSTDLSQIKNEAERKRIARIQQQLALPFEMDEDDIAAIFEG
ncbi:MAG: bacteriophage Gp15 family protein [Ruminococcus flavefaciens]|nr:bacteriophage Gp15 family protein [Ruminococcus flavefaciens]MCM1060569.1 bacteriophage Gp15 family protein [Eubacterium sp.]